MRRELSLTHSRPHSRSPNALNIYQISLYHVFFLYKLPKNQMLKIFHNVFEKPTHKYPTQL